ncbi:MAG: gamma-glutamyl-gamma-aminobutyrate hydrolase family protein [Clostridiaceae bacterium]|nr:gamma-glutamyl-gamma-aminobutyrate hydrolase family protein [Clostridiaceae bacterium]
MHSTVIAVTSNRQPTVWDGHIEGSYCQSILQSEGLPLLVPPVEQDEHLDRLVELCDGFLFTGGIDIHPKYFGEDILNDTVEIDEIRDAFELKLIKKVIQANKPLLAICRGIQVLNVALEGTLYQDLPTQLGINHRDLSPLLEGGHDVSILKDTPLYRIVNEDTIKVNTRHHQAIKNLGNGLSVMAVSNDDVIEAVYMPEKKYVLGVQWHPEMLSHKYMNHKIIFDDFIRHCQC